MMASYSKVFKAANLSVMKEVKVIAPAYIHAEAPPVQTFEENSPIETSPLIQEARQEAEEILQTAREKARALETAAEEKIDQWWVENKEQLEQMSVEAKEQGFQAGFTAGMEEVAAKLEREYQDKIGEAQQILEQAYQQKEAIIAEAEPFLLELSTVIATQIIKQELSDCPEKFVELVKQHILRFKEKEQITICVHPDDFSFIQSQRAQLLAVVNGETEMKIIPDHTVTPKGCIIRTAYGSVDARIDTQIEEIKKAILDVKARALS